MKNSNLFKVSKIINGKSQTTHQLTKEKNQLNQQKIKQKENIFANSKLKQTQKKLVNQQKFQTNVDSSQVLKSKYFNSNSKQSVSKIKYLSTDINKNQKIHSKQKKILLYQRKSQNCQSLNLINPTLNHSSLSQKNLTQKKQTYQNDKSFKKVYHSRASIQHINGDNILQKKLKKLISPLVSQREQSQTIVKQQIKNKRRSQSSCQMENNFQIKNKQKQSKSTMLLKKNAYHKQTIIELSKFQWTCLIHQFYILECRRKKTSKLMFQDIKEYLKKIDTQKMLKIKQNFESFKSESILNAFDLISQMQSKINLIQKEEKEEKQNQKLQTSFQQLMMILFSFNQVKQKPNIQIQKCSNKANLNQVADQQKKQVKYQKTKNFVQKKEDDEQIIQTARFQQNQINFLYHNNFSQNKNHKFATNQLILKKLSKKQDKVISTPSVFTPSPKLKTNQSQHSLRKQFALQSNQNEIQSFFKDQTQITHCKMQMNISQYQNNCAQQYPIQQLQLNCSKPFIQSIIFSNFCYSNMNISFSQQPFESGSLMEKTQLNFQQIVSKIKEISNQMKNYYAQKMQNSSLLNSKAVNLQDFTQLEILLQQIISYKVFKANNSEQKHYKQSQESYFYACKLNQLNFTSKSSQQAVYKFLDSNIIQQYFGHIEGIKITSSPYLAKLSNVCLKNCSQIKLINFSYNKIVGLQKINLILQKNKKTLQFINLSGNLISDISTLLSIQNWSQLKQIHLKKNRIIKINFKSKTQNVLHFPKLQIIDFRDNLITFQEKSSIFNLIKVNANLNILALVGNPIIESCKFDEIQNFMFEHSIYQYQSLQMMSQYVKYKEICFQDSKSFCLSQIVQQGQMENAQQDELEILKIQTNSQQQKISKNQLKQKQIKCNYLAEVQNLSKKQMNQYKFKQKQTDYKKQTCQNEKPNFSIYDNYKAKIKKDPLFNRKI